MVKSIDEQIQRAIQDGQFDNLPGKGKPLYLSENPYEDPEWRLANKILHDAGFSPPWIEKRQEIEAEIGSARRVLIEAYSSRRASIDAGLAGAQIEKTWETALTVFRGQVKEINKQIFNYNLEVPHIQFQKPLLNSEREIDRVMAS